MDWRDPEVSGQDSQPAWSWVILMMTVCLGVVILLLVIAALGVGS